MFPLETKISRQALVFTAATITRCWFQSCFQDNLIIWRERVETSRKETRILDLSSSQHSDANVLNLLRLIY